MTCSASTTPSHQEAFDVASIRAEFPNLKREAEGRPIVYLDNAATTHKPNVVIESITNYYENFNSNVHRGVHRMSQEATAMYEGARETVRAHLGAASTREIIFTRGTTEAINLVAQTFGRTRLGTDDEVLVSTMEHHSNIVPWQLVCEQTGARLRVIPMSNEGELVLDELGTLITDRTKIVAVGHVSNALGTINPVELLIARAHQVGAVVLIDGAQAVPHMAVDVNSLNADFYAMSAHKVYGPTGIGVLYGKESILSDLPPYQSGGDMIRSVSFAGTTFNELPSKYEAGTPNIAGAVGLGCALEFVNRLGLDRIAKHESRLLSYATKELRAIPGLTLVGTATNKASVLSFTLDYAHPHDIGTILDAENIAVRAGHHCAQPVMDRLGITATARASLGLYNNENDIDALVHGLKRVHEVLG